MSTANGRERGGKVQWSDEREREKVCACVTENERETEIERTLREESRPFH